MSLTNHPTEFSASYYLFSGILNKKRGRGWPIKNAHSISRFPRTMLNIPKSNDEMATSRVGLFLTNSNFLGFMFQFSKLKKSKKIKVFFSLLLLLLLL